MPKDAPTETAVETTDTPPTYSEQTAADYGQYVAVQPLDWFGCAAFREGDRVPASHPGVPAWRADGAISPVTA